MDFLVSVVVPTRNRPLLVKRAVKSVLAQTIKEIEVIVIIDGLDLATRVVFGEIDDPRLRVIELPTNRGVSVARNTGVSKAKGEWIAFLDDDDEWLPQKLELQIEAARRSPYAFPIIASCLIARAPKVEYIWPRRLLTPSEPISEYLLARNTLFQGEGLVHTSTLLIKKDLLQKVPFKENLRKHEDWDWLLRVNKLEGVGIEFVPEPLAIWYIEEKRKSLSTTSDWHYSLSWIQENRDLVTPRAYSSFLILEVGNQAAKSAGWRTFLSILWEAVRLGQPKPIDLQLYFGMWLIPQETRRALRALFGKHSNSEEFIAN